MIESVLKSLLRDVSRSFYLTLRVLPAAVRPQIGLAYLLARTTDTVADTELVPLERRLNALAALRARILGNSQDPVDFGDFAKQQGSPSERLLLERAEGALACLHELGAEDLQLVRNVLNTITSGQELDLRRFDGASEKNLIALTVDNELDDYTYRVAGCVGEFWTRMCRAHLFPTAQLDDVEMLTKGVRFGKGLQLVNILRDLPSDLRHGRCYVPLEALRSAGLKPSDLLERSNRPKFHPVLETYLSRAEQHLRAGWEYTIALPRRCVRVRLACAWPLQIGWETIQLLRAGNVLSPEPRIKASRRKVRQLMLSSLVRYPWPAAWNGLLPVVPPRVISY